MIAYNLFLIAILSGLAVSFPNFLTSPNYKGVQDWKRAATVSSVSISAAVTSTRGSQPAPTDPCFNVYQLPAPVNNASGPGPDGVLGFGYQAPGSNDVRGPCPALNTLANHGYLPRDGRGINGSTLLNAFLNGWGISNGVVNIAKTNALSVCSLQGGGSENGSPYEECESFDLNILNEPHQFEHDHSLSRRDYEEISQNGPADNHIFNGTVFNQSLAVLNNSCYMTTSQANEVRLKRESEQYLLDKVGWLTLAPGTQETEIGFIFAAMSEDNQPGGNGSVASALVRVSWWQYWFMYESFPTPLGWKIPNPSGSPVQNSFVTSISALVQSASITSTPSPFFTEFVFGPTGTFPSQSTSGTPSFNPTLANLYTTEPGIQQRMVAAATPTPA